MILLACVVVCSHVIYSVCTSSCTDGVFPSLKTEEEEGAES